jgi:hypothetical protein
LLKVAERASLAVDRSSPCPLPLLTKQHHLAILPQLPAGRLAGIFIFVTAAFADLT